MTTRGRTTAILALLFGLALLVPAVARPSGAAGTEIFADGAAAFAHGAAAGTEIFADGADGQPGPHDYTRTEATASVVDGPDDDHTVDIDYDLYVPDNATPSTPQPAILLMHGFGNDKRANEMLANAAFLASHGYVVLAYSFQGFGGSGGCIELDSIDWDVKDARQLIDILAARPDVATEASGDPVIGVLGGSYGGGAQLLLAATDARVDTVVPARTWNDLAYSLDPNNFATPGLDGLDFAAQEQGVFKQEWTSLFFASGQSQPAMGNGGCDPVSQQLAFPGQPPCPGFDPRVCITFDRVSTTGDAAPEDRALLAASSGSRFVDRVNVPVLLQQGQSDTLFNLNEAVASYTALRNRGVPVSMIWNSGGHGGYDGEPGEGEPFAGNFDDTDASQRAFAASYLPRRFLGWFDHYLRGDGDGDPGPGFAYFRDWVEYDVAATGGTAAPAYGTAASYPVGATRTYTLEVTGDTGGRLLPPGAIPVDGSATFLNPAGGEPAAYSETSNFSSPGQPGDRDATEVLGQNLTFTTAPVRDPLDVVGIPTARLELTHDNGRDLVFFGKVYDVAPDGTDTLIHRLIAPVRVPADHTGPVDINLLGMAHRFEAGHAVRLVLAATDQTSYNAKVADAITLSSRPGAVSTFTLPVPELPALERVQGADRIETSAAVSRRSRERAGTVIIARADAFPDALAAAPLATAVGAPVLLTASDRLDPRVAAEIDRLGATRAIIVGGPTAISIAAESDLRGRDLEVQRLSGPTRYDTAAVIARDLVRRDGTVREAIVARGDTFPDALAAGNLATAAAIPILLTTPSQVPAVTRAALDDLIAGGRVDLAGGKTAIATTVADELRAGGFTVERYAGDTRYGTAVAMVQQARTRGAGIGLLFAASGTDFPDALSAVPAAAALGGSLVLVDPVRIGASEATVDFVTGNAAVIESVIVVGGRAAVSDMVASDLAAFAGG